ncbi:MAG: DNA primase noncatalytic subunit PriX [Nitrosarchaeum sp.]
MEVREGLDFLLNHFSSKFPRTISTAKTGNRQVWVYSKEEVLEHFTEADYVDCRVSAFGKYEIDNEIPNLIFADVDNLGALDEVRALFYKEIGGIPTILFSGNGYNVIQPIHMISLNDSRHNNKQIDRVDKKLLLFAERHLTNNKCDLGNHPSTRSCQIRVPGSYNSKVLKKDDYENAKVRIIQEWDGNRADVRSLPFKKYLDKVEKQNRFKIKNFTKNSSTIQYIENLLKNKITDGRKRIFALVLCPYLINIKKLSINETSKVIIDYFNGYITQDMIEYEVKQVSKKGVLPYSLSNMKENDPELYSIVTNIMEVITK